MYNHEKDKQGQKCKIAENDHFTPLSSHFWGEIKNTWVPPFKFLSFQSLFKQSKRNWTFLFNFSLPNFSLLFRPNQAYPKKEI
jgi:hypothetical protein